MNLKKKSNINDHSAHGEEYSQGRWNSVRAHFGFCPVMLYMVIVIKQKNTRHPFNSQTNILSHRESAVHKRKLSLTPKLAKQIVSPKTKAQRKNNFSFPWVENKQSLYMHFMNVKDTGGKRILPDKKEVLTRVEKKQTSRRFWSCASPDSFFPFFFLLVSCS